MNTRWRWLGLALLVISAMTPSVASARWKLESVAWERQNNAVGYNGGTYGIPPNNAGILDTLYASAAAARVDTTASWNMLDCDNLLGTATGYGGAADDSLASAYLVIQGDSTVASTITFATTTIQFQVNYGANSSGWTSVNGTAYPHNFTAAAKIIHQPIWNHISGLIDKDATAEAGGITTGGTTAVFAPRMRAIITWGTAAACPSCRAFIKKWVTEQIITLQGKDF